MIERILISTNAIIPIVLFLVAGYISRVCGVIRREDVALFNRINFYVFIPVLVCYNIYSSDVNSAFNVPFILFAVCGIIMEALIAYPLARFFVKKRDQKGVFMQGIFRTNIALVGITLIANLIPDADLGPLSILTAFTTITINTLSTIVLEMYSSNQKVSAAKILKNVAQNPIILGGVIGALLLVSGIRLPVAVNNTLRDLARVASPLSLFLLGAFFRFDGVKSGLGILMLSVIMRLFVLPGLFLTLAGVLGFRGIFFASLIPVFASATAAPSFTMVQKLGGDEELAGNIIVFTSLLCPLSIFLWCFVFQMANMF